MSKNLSAIYIKKVYRKKLLKDIRILLKIEKKVAIGS